MPAQAAPASLLEAMLAVQAEAPTLEKDRTVKVQTKTGGEYSYSYTPLDSIVSSVERPGMSAFCDCGGIVRVMPLGLSEVPRSS